MSVVKSVQMSMACRCQFLFTVSLSERTRDVSGEGCRYVNGVQMSISLLDCIVCQNVHGMSVVKVGCLMMT